MLFVLEGDSSQAIQPNRTGISKSGRPENMERGSPGKVTKTQPACRLIADLINDWYCYADLKFDSKTITARLQDRY